ncbi:hypothetical protein [Aureimonas altamirensis]|nr:hypothetical protein [Aureimonas altamirensis]
MSATTRLPPVAFISTTNVLLLFALNPDLYRRVESEIVRIANQLSLCITLWTGFGGGSSVDNLDRLMEKMIADAFDWSAPPPPIAVVVPDDDEAGGHIDSDLGYAEGQSFMIEYRDSRGRVTSRRITVFGIKDGKGQVPLLMCRCHERKANRSFRVDRILTCIDYDGEVHGDVPLYLSEAFGMSFAVASRAEEADERNSWPRVMACIKPHATLLAALSHSDGLMLDEELDEATDHCVWMADHYGFTSSQGFRSKIRAYVKRQKPTRGSVWDACAKLREEDRIAEAEFFRAAIRVIDADGLRHPEEEILINEISIEMTGVAVI